MYNNVYYLWPYLIPDNRFIRLERLYILGVPVEMKNKILLFMLIVLITPSSSREEIVEGQIALNGYVDNSGKVLLTGYASPESLSFMSFLVPAQYTYDNSTNQLYAVTDVLTSKNAGTWFLNFSAQGYYSDYTITFFLPESSEVMNFEISEGLNYQIQVMNDSLVMAIYGYGIASPNIGISYMQPVDVPEETENESSSWFSLVILLGIVFITAIIILFFRIRKKILPDENMDLHEYEAAPIITEIKATSQMQKVIDTLSDNEKAIINLMLKKGGSLTQADIRYETGIPKSSLSGIINALKRKNIIKKREYGRTNVIELSEWFLSEKETG